MKDGYPNKVTELDCLGSSIDATAKGGVIVIEKTLVLSKVPSTFATTSQSKPNHKAAGQGK